MRDALLSAAKGAAIGGTMLIPGVSGGTTAMMLGIYDRLIQAVSGFRRHKRESFFFLLWFCLGACAGIFLLARPLLSLMEHFPRPAGFFFLGAVAGSVPMVYEKSRIGSFQWRVPVYVLMGAALVFLLDSLPAPAHQAAADGMWRPLLRISQPSRSIMFSARWERIIRTPFAVSSTEPPPTATRLSHPLFL